MNEIALQRKLHLEQELRAIVANLVARCRPQCIILFGGLARGDCGEWSDIDLCVIQHTSLPFLARIDQVRTATGSTEAMDLVVYTPDEWREMRRQGNYFIRDEILGRGRVLYGDTERMDP